VNRDYCEIAAVPYCREAKASCELADGLKVLSFDKYHTPSFSQLRQYRIDVGTEESKNSL